MQHTKYETQTINECHSLKDIKALILEFLDNEDMHTLTLTKQRQLTNKRPRRVYDIPLEALSSCPQ